MCTVQDLYYSWWLIPVAYQLKMLRWNFDLSQHRGWLQSSVKAIREQTAESACTASQERLLKVR